MPGDLPQHVMMNATSDASDEKPRLIIPDPGYAAIVTFSHRFAIVLLSDGDTSGPEAQLLLEAHRAPNLFQEFVELREDKHVAILGASLEAYDERTGQVRRASAGVDVDLVLVLGDARHRQRHRAVGDFEDRIYTAVEPLAGDAAADIRFVLVVGLQDLEGLLEELVE